MLIQNTYKLPIFPGKLTTAAEHRRTLANGEAAGHRRQSHSTLTEVAATCELINGRRVP